MPAEWATYLALARFLVHTISKQPAETLPPVVAGLLSSLLPPQADLAPLRADLAEYLRRTSDRAAWFQEAELAEVCAVLDGLHSYDSGLVTGTDMAVLLERLVDAEERVGGPYRELDGLPHPSTNAFVNQVLTWAAEPLPNVSALLSHADRLFVPKRQAPVEKTMLYVLKQADTGAEALLPHLQQLRDYSHLIIAALGAQILHQSEQYHPVDRSLSTHAKTIYARSQELPVTEEPLAAKTKHMLRTVVQADYNHEIAALPWMYGQTIGYTSRSRHTLYKHLGIANVYAWAAYTIYDDFLDDEGDPTLLATANYLLRALTREYYAALPDTPSFQTFVEKSLTTIDTANTYETTYLRFAATASTITVGPLPQYGNEDLLADRALFHVLGPMGVLAAVDEKIGGATWNQTLKAFRHYLIARQLNDDIHDWVKDLRAGQISFVVAALLRYLGTSPGIYNLDELLEHARPVFWQNVLPTICNTALEHIAEAKRMPAPDPNLFTNSHLMQLFTNVESSMHAADRQRVVSQEFIGRLHL